MDTSLVRRNIVPDYRKARAMIMAGLVVVDGERIEKSGFLVKIDSNIYLKGDNIPYVSRGGVKLEGALNAFSVDVYGRTALDVGASTGGFTDCLLKRGVKKVYAVDVGYGQLAWSLQQDSRVVNMDRRNIRFLDAGELEEEINLAVIDASFISLRLVLPKVVDLIGAKASIIALIKPQFEVAKNEVEEGGVIRDEKKRKRVVEEITSFCRGIGLKPSGTTESPILGPKGNQECFIYLGKG